MADRCNDCPVESEFACLCLINDLILIYANYQVVPKCLVSFPFNALPCKEYTNNPKKMVYRQVRIEDCAFLIGGQGEHRHRSQR